MAALTPPDPSDKDTDGTGHFDPELSDELLERVREVAHDIVERVRQVTGEEINSDPKLDDPSPANP
jgi:hypothetical protein